MVYRKFSSKIKFKPSALGYGLMRLPINEDHSINADEAIKIVRLAIDNGVNYLDTAYMYHGGESEKIAAEILKDGYRAKVKIATKFPMWNLKEEADLDRIFFEQREKLQVQKIDFYLLHALGKNSLATIKKFNMIAWLEKKKKEGYIDYIGFSFHDHLTYFKKIIDFYHWDFCMVQFNVVDQARQAGIAGIKYAHQKGVGVIAMEPLRGGQLTTSIPSDINQLWEAMAKLYGDKIPNPPKYLLDWVWNFKEIAFLNSGMSNMEQVQSNLATAKKAKINKLTKKQLTLFNKIKKAYLAKTVVNCTKCDYCKMCPQKIAIPYIFEQYNEIKRFENQTTPTFRYHFLGENERANQCTACRACVALCPQKIDIPVVLQKCSAVFDRKEKFDFSAH